MKHAFHPAPRNYAEPQRETLWLRAVRKLRPPRLLLLLLISIILSESRVNAQTGAWTPLTNLAPYTCLGGLQLLTDGTVLVKSTYTGGVPGYGNIWMKLTPDATGSYVNGTWTTIAPMHVDRDYFSTQVMPDGRVYVGGGEWCVTTGGSSDGEIYDPIADTWTPPFGATSLIKDGASEILPSGKILESFYGPGSSEFDPSTLLFATPVGSAGSNTETSWLKLPDNSTLFIDVGTSNSERYIPATSTWVADATLPVALYDAYWEAGPCFLLPDGRAFFTGGTGHTAFYTPSGTSAPGTWAAGPDIPGGLACPDAAGAMMVNGKIILTCSPPGVFLSPMYFYEFDYTTNTYTAVSAPGGGSSLGMPSYYSNFICLPDGSILFETQLSNQLYEYTPGTPALASGKPTLSAITRMNCETYKIKGMLFNGITEGGSYGDDWQMSTNYPIVRFSNGGNVYYARTTNWNFVGGVMTGTAICSAEITLPPGVTIGTTYNVEVVANGNPSAPIPFTPMPATAYPIICPGTYCLGGAGAPIGLAGSDIGEVYQVYSGITPVGTPVTGTGGPISFGLFPAGAYSVMVDVGTPCATSLGSVNIITGPGTLPLVYPVTGGGTSCAPGTPFDISVTGSTSGDTYQLYLGGYTAVGSPVTGTGTTVDMGYQTLGGNYTVVATNSMGCNQDMSGSATITVNPLPTVYYLSGGSGGGPCVGTDVALNWSDIGINYEIYINGVASGIVLAGTGGYLDFGFQTTPGIYTVVETNTVTGCQSTAVGSLSIMSPPALFTVTGGGHYCAGGAGVHVGLSGSQTGFYYQLTIVGSYSPVGLWGTGGPLDFGLMTVAGTYIVTAWNVTCGASYPMTGSVTITIDPTPNYYIVTGGGTICAGDPGVAIGLTGSDPGATYQLFDGLTLEGTTAGTGSAISFGPQTAPGTYTVVASLGSLPCTATMAGTATITVNPAPGVFTITGGGGYCAGGTGVHVGLTGSETGVSYVLSIGGVAAATLTGTGAALDFGLQTLTGACTVVATNTSTGCTSNMTGSITITVNPVPTVYAITGGGSYCSGGTGVHVGLTGSQSGVSYTLSIGGITATTLAGTGAALDFGLETLAGACTVVASAGGCTSSMTGSISITINPLPAVYTITGGGGYCAGGTGVHVGLSGSQSGVSYTLSIGGVTATTMAGTGAALDFGLETLAGTCTVVATNTTTSCTSNMTGTISITINPIPTVYTITGGGSYCSGGTGVHVGLTGSQSGVSYTLSIGGITATTLSGTGAALDFGLETLAGACTVVASAGGCTSSMTGSISITINPLPAVYTITGGGGYCAGGTGVHVGLSGSQSGVSYTLSIGGVTATTMAGTGAALDFGLETLAGTCTVVATNTTTSCTSNMTGSISITINPVPTVYTITGGGSYCSGGTGVHVGLTGSQSGVSYTLSIGGITATTLSGTGAALDFGLETLAGACTVVASAGGCTSSMTGSISITINPLPAVYTITGGGGYCAGGTGVHVGLSGSQSGVSYTLSIGGVTATTMVGTGAALDFGLETLAGTCTVVATNTTTSCASNMTGSISITINPLPTVYTITGGGTYCSGGTGVHVGLTGSQSGVSYTLSIGGVVATTLAGTGAALDFGLETLSGTCTVVATNTSTSCTSNMTGTISIIISPAPTPFLVTGGGSYCAGGAGVHVGLASSVTGTSYTLFCGGISVTTLSGTGTALDFGLQTTAGIYTIQGTITATSCTGPMTGSVTIAINPLPSVYTITGGGSYCAGGAGVHVGLSGSQTGVSYTLSIGGVTATTMAGTGVALDFGLETLAGSCTVVATNTTTGCTSSMVGSISITINALPAVFTITGGGGYCAGGTGVHVGLSGSQAGVSYTLSIGGVVATTLAGTGSALDFGLETLGGACTVVATNTSTGCTNTMTGSVSITINPMPSAITGNNSVCLGYPMVTLYDAVPGGAWTSSNTSVATIGVSGTVTAMGVGVTTISYTMTGGCYVTMPFYVYNDSRSCGPCNQFSGAFTTLGTTLSTPIGAGKYYLNNDLTINGNVTLTSAVILIEPGYHIFVKPNSSLTLNGCHIYCACGMWRGIILQSNLTETGTIVLEDDGVNSTLIEDAITGVDVEDPVAPAGGAANFVQSTNTIFNRDDTGISIINYAPNAPATYQFFVDNTVFTARDFTNYSLYSAFYSSIVYYPLAWPTSYSLKQYWNPSSVDPVNGPYEAPVFIANPNAISLGYGFPGEGPHNGGYYNPVQFTIGISMLNVGSAATGFPGVLIGADNTTTITYYGGPNNVEQNLFDTINYGMRVINANVTSENNVFAHMEQKTYIATASIPDHGGIGIYTNMNNGGKYQLTVQPSVYPWTMYGMSGTNVAPNYFYNNIYGVYSNNYWQVNGLQSVMMTTQNNTINPNSNFFGYDVISDAYNDVELNSNTITNIANAISFTATYSAGYWVSCCGGLMYYVPGSQHAGTINVNSNSINAALGGALPTTQYCSYGISLQNIISGWSSVATGSVNTNSNTITSANRGILVNSFNMTGQSASSDYNNITVTGDLVHWSQCYGINHTNCIKDYIYANTVNTADETATVGNVSSYYASSNSSLIIDCNFSGNTNFGFHYYLSNPGTQWVYNTMDDSHYGLTLDNSMIGTQGSAGNPIRDGWTGGTAWWSAFCQTMVINTPPASSSPLYVTGPAVTSDPIYNCSTIPGDEYGLPGTIFVTSSGLHISPCPIVRINPLPVFQQAYENIATLHVNYLPNPQQQFTSQLGEWEGAAVDPDITTGSSVMEDFQTIATGSRYAMMTNIENQLFGGNANAADSIILAGVPPLVRTGYYIDPLTGVTVADNSDADYIVNNYLNFYSAYLDYMAFGMTPADTGTIVTIANECPLIYGSVVYQARAMYSAIFNVLNVWPDTCNGGNLGQNYYVDSTWSDTTGIGNDSDGNNGNNGGNRSSAQNGSGNAITDMKDGQKYTLQPNPNNGNFTLSQLVTDEQPVIAQIWNVTGESVFKDNLNFMNGRDNISLSNLMPGIYILQLTDMQGRQFLFKFAVH